MSEPDTHPGWQGILDEGERILWQGRPSSRVRITGAAMSRMAPGLAISAFALVWMAVALQANMVFALFGLIFLARGLWDAATPALLPAFIRSRSWYTLTDRRMIVARDLPFKGRFLISHPITATTPVELVADEPASVLLGLDSREGEERPGFHLIDQADRVMALIRKIQTEAAPRSQEEWLE